MLQRTRRSNHWRDNSASTFVPLQHVTVDARIRSFAADVTISQVFRNQESVPIEAVYCFPIEEQAAIYAFVARIGDREIIAELKEKKDAQREYNTALREHHGAYLLEQDESSPDNFIINVGALPPNEQCEIRISYVSELDLVENGTIIRFVVPTTIAPRYNPNVGTIASPVKGIPTEYVQSAPYTINFHCQVDKNNIARVSSLSHPIQVDVNGQDTYQIDFAQQNTHLDRDIIVDFQLAEQRSNTIVAVESGAIMAALTPTEEHVRSILPDRKLTNEFLFIVDCSGSMDENNKIGLARQAMLLFLKSLPVGCLFNIIRFGSSHQSLFKTVTAVYNKQNAQQAERLCTSMQANMGGTELLRPLEWLKENPPSAGHSRQIFLLTDGEVSNVDEVTRLCRSMATSTRIFSYGLGSSPSRSLIKGLARSTNGRFVFIPPNINVDLYVGEQLQRALQPALTNVQIKLNVDPTRVDIVPRHPPPVFVHDRLVVYALLKDKQSTVFDQQVTVELHSEQHRLCTAQINRIPSVADNGTIARLAAKARIIELQHLEPCSSASSNAAETNKEIVRLSLQYHILSPLTAFIGVERRTNGNNADMRLRHVPIEIAADNPYERRDTQLRSAAHRQQHDAEMIREQEKLRAEFEEYLEIIISNGGEELLEPERLKKRILWLHQNAQRCQLNHPKHDETQGYSTLQRIEQFLSETFLNPDSKSSRRARDLSEEAERDMEQAPVRQQQIQPSKNRFQQVTEQTKDEDLELVRHIIAQQQFDGLWNVDERTIEKLTSKSLADFEQMENNTTVLITAVIIAAFEERFASLSSLWHGVVQKARARLIQLLNNDKAQLDELLGKIRVVL